MDELTKATFVSPSCHVSWAVPPSVANPAVADLFGRDPKPIDWLVAAPAGASVDADVFQEEGETFLFCAVKLSDSARELEFSSQISFGRLGGQVSARLDYLNIQPPKAGLGVRWFATLVRRLRSGNVKSIGLVAAKGPNFNGYYTWPVWGFEIHFDDTMAERASRAGFNCRSTHELLLKYGDLGRNWWRESGVEAEAVFDLAPNSRRILSYGRNRNRMSRILRVPNRPARPVDLILDEVDMSVATEAFAEVAAFPPPCDYEDCRATLGEPSSEG